MKPEGAPIGSVTPEQERGSRFKIETVAGPAENGVSFSPERGGIMTSMKLGGQEVLYMDGATFEDEAKNVKGGIPVLFPNAGPLREEENPYPGLKQHGFARTSGSWTVEAGEGQGWVESFVANDETKKLFPYDFQLKMAAQLEADGSVSLSQAATNLEEEKDMPLAMGLHPYFRVPSAGKGNIKFDFPGGDTIEQAVDEWSNDGTVSVDNPKLRDPDEVLRVTIPGLGTLTMDVSPEYKKILVWSLPGRDFVCVEPVMRDDNGLIDDPELVKPGTTFQGRVNYRLEREGQL